MSKLPGGIDRARYEWPQISLIHPEFGTYNMDVHCVRNPQTDAMVLIVFPGVAPIGKARRLQVDLVADVAEGMGDVIVELNGSDISDDVKLRLAANIAAHPDEKIILMQVQRP
jgi:hypothetical protein